MMKAEMDKECKICTRPFTVFRWKPGPAARYKKTEVCQTCAKLKNVCQTCLLDLEFGLPVQVRDAVSGNTTNIPVSDTNREWFTDQAERSLTYGQDNYNRAAIRQNLVKIARTAPYYKRNESHICSFFLKGECKRGAECPYRHEIPEKTELSEQNMKDRFYGVNDPVARKLIGKLNNNALVPPEDSSIRTLYVGNVDSSISEADLRDQFYPFGEIQDIKLVPKSLCAFVTYASREAAEHAAERLHNNLTIKDAPLRIAWSKPQAFDEGTGPVPRVAKGKGNEGSAQGSANYFGLPVAPVGVSSSQSLPVGPGRNIYPSMNPQQFGSRSDR